MAAQQKPEIAKAVETPKRMVTITAKAGTPSTGAINMNPARGMMNTAATRIKASDNKSVNPDFGNVATGIGKVR
jgi:hypothetical protein